MNEVIELHRPDSQSIYAFMQLMCKAVRSSVLDAIDNVDDFIHVFSGPRRDDRSSCRLRQKQI